MSAPSHHAPGSHLKRTAGEPTVKTGAIAISHFVLDNGLKVVVIPDHRAAVVTHMLWYRNGSADDPPGKSGIAHFLEHLMFKGTSAHPAGAFSATVAELGGQENAFTSYDFTAYYQRIAPEHLATMMAFEADRMRGLVLSDAIIAPERDVVLEERRMRTDGDPASQLNEAMQSALFIQHPYGRPVIGWQHEIEGYQADDALSYYERFYTPENAVLVVAGDVEPGTVEDAARSTYGRVARRREPPRRFRPREPKGRTHRLLTLRDPRVRQPSTQRLYLVPSYSNGDSSTTASLEVLAYLLGGGPTSLLYTRLVIEQQVAVAAGAHYSGHSLDDARFMLYALPVPAAGLEELDRAIDAVIEEMISLPLAAADLQRAKTKLVAETVFAQDSQVSLAQWYGSALTTGQTIAEIADWPTQIEAVTADQVKHAAEVHLSKSGWVSGHLLSVPETGSAA